MSQAAEPISQADKADRDRTAYVLKLRDGDAANCEAWLMMTDGIETLLFVNFELEKGIDHETDDYIKGVLDKHIANSYWSGVASALRTLA